MLYSPRESSNRWGQSETDLNGRERMREPGNELIPVTKTNDTKIYLDQQRAEKSISADYFPPPPAENNLTRVVGPFSDTAPRRAPRLKPKHPTLFRVRRRLCCRTCHPPPPLPSQLFSAIFKTLPFLRCGFLRGGSCPPRQQRREDDTAGATVKTGGGDSGAG